jgi:hypothetical protein
MLIDIAKTIVFGEESDVETAYLCLTGHDMYLYTLTDINKLPWWSIQHTSISPSTSHVKRSEDFKGKGNMCPKPRYLKYVTAYHGSRRG